MLDKFVPRGSKRTLFFLAGMVWMFAGYKVSSMGADVLIQKQNHLVVSSIVAIAAFLIFFNFIFKKMALKHQKRIRGNEKDKVCLFSFFDAKGYLIMAFMMTLGITIRNIEAINPLYWAGFYVGLGSALFLAGVLFAVAWVRFYNVKEV